MEIEKAMPTCLQRLARITARPFPEITGNYRFAAIVSAQLRIASGFAPRVVRKTGNALRGAETVPSAVESGTEKAAPIRSIVTVRSGFGLIP